MSDNKDKAGPQAAARVNVHEDYEVAYWTKKWGVTKAALEAAVKKVGSSSSTIAKELGK